MADAVRIMTDVALDELEAQIALSDVVVCLRWPTAGEVSASLMRALGAGKPVIASDVLQYRDLDPSFCWRVPTDGLREAERHRGRRCAASSRTPPLPADAGAAARRFVEAEATLSASADRYLDAIGECAVAQESGERVIARRGRSPRADVPGVNLIADWQATTGLAEAARRSAGAIGRGWNRCRRLRGSRGLRASRPPAHTRLAR